MGGQIERKEGRKESKNLCFILGSHTPESLFVYFVPAHLSIVCPAYVLWTGHPKPLLLLEGEFCSTVSYPLPHFVYPCCQVQELFRQPYPSITGPFTKLNRLTYLAETFFCWVSELNWYRASSDRHGRDRE